MKYSNFFKKELQKLREEGLYRNFREIDRPIKKFPKAEELKDDKERDVEVWCSNDYLNMSQHPEVVNETVKTLLEIGTGSGYQTSILSILSRRVYSIERIRPLLVNAISCFKKLKLTNIICECGDGFLGWSKLAPFDHLIITCAVEKIDNRLLSQVRFNGTCVVPVGSVLKGQRLKKITVKNNRENDIWEDLGQVNFVPLISDNY